MKFRVIYKLHIKNQNDRHVTNINGLWALYTNVPWQTVKAVNIIPKMREIEKSEGNRFARIKIKKLDPNEEKNFTAEVTIETNSNFVQHEILNRSWVNEYTKERKYWEFVPELKEIVDSLNELDEKTQIIETLKFVNSKIKLRTNLTERLGVKKVIKTLEGDCDEFSDLTISILRQLGIPSRRIVGYYYKQDGETIGHAWLEAYLENSWIQLDPALNRFIQLNERYIARLRQGFTPDTSTTSMKFTGGEDKKIEIKEITELYRLG